MRKIIVNADDLGYSFYVNKNIENCIKKGVITSSTLIANGPAFDDGVRIAKEYTEISVGVHLNLVEFFPLTNRSVFQKYGIVNSSGVFIEGAVFFCIINDELKRAIYEEWDAQICKVKQAGIRISHVDSHEHTHTIKKLEDILTAVMNKHDIKCVRRKIVPSIRMILFGDKSIKITYDKSKAVVEPKHSFIYRKLNFLYIKIQNLIWNLSMEKKFKMTDSFFSFKDFYLNRSLLNLGDENAIIELMCHPGQHIFDKETEKLVNDNTWLSTYELTNYLNIQK